MTSADYNTYYYYYYYYYFFFLPSANVVKFRVATGLLPALLDAVTVHV